MTVADTAAPALAGTRLADYLQLTRPRLCVMALLTVAAGAVLASGGAPDWRIMTHALVGAALVAAGASALNQWSEREVDAGCGAPGIGRCRREDSSPERCSSLESHRPRAASSTWPWRSRSAWPPWSPP